MTPKLNPNVDARPTVTVTSSTMLVAPDVAQALRERSCGPRPSDPGPDESPAASGGRSSRIAA